MKKYIVLSIEKIKVLQKEKNWLNDFKTTDDKEYYVTVNTKVNKELEGLLNEIGELNNKKQELIDKIINYSYQKLKLKDILIDEFVIWKTKNGNGRNSDDLRFGQYFFNKYSLEVDISYNLENATEVFELLYNYLNKK